YKEQTGNDLSTMSLSEKVIIYANNLYNMTTEDAINAINSKIDVAKSELEEYKAENNTSLRSLNFSPTKSLGDMIKSHAKSIEKASGVVKMAAMMLTGIMTGGGALASIAITGFATVGLEILDEATDSDGLTWADTKKAAVSGALASLFATIGIPTGKTCELLKNRILQAAKEMPSKKILAWISSEFSSFSADTAVSLTVGNVLGETTLDEEAQSNLIGKVLKYTFTAGAAGKMILNGTKLSSLIKDVIVPKAKKVAKVYSDEFSNRNFNITAEQIKAAIDTPDDVINSINELSALSKNKYNKDFSAAEKETLLKMSVDDISGIKQIIQTSNEKPSFVDTANFLFSSVLTEVRGMLSSLKETSVNAYNNLVSTLKEDLLLALRSASRLIKEESEYIGFSKIQSDVIGVLESHGFGLGFAEKFSQINALYSKNPYTDGNWSWWQNITRKNIAQQLPTKLLAFLPLSGQLTNIPSLFGAHPKTYAFTCQNGSEVVGGMLGVRSRNTMTLGTMSTTNNLSPLQRMKTVFKMLEEVWNKAKADGITTLRFEVKNDNNNAESIYSKIVEQLIKKGLGNYVEGPITSGSSIEYKINLTDGNGVYNQALIDYIVKMKGNN
ncbi:hypothetical protein IJS77_00750, partial [bacterium]|nr:hypothetical protein [bacterium]